MAEQNDYFKSSSDNTQTESGGRKIYPMTGELIAEGEKIFDKRVREELARLEAEEKAEK